MRKRRLNWAACEAISKRHGGIKAMAQVTGLSERTIKVVVRNVVPKKIIQMG